MRKRFAKAIAVMTLIAALTISWAVPSFAADAKEKPPETDSTSAIVMDAETGTVIYEKNAREKRDPASITKILNCLVVMDRLDPEQQVTVSFDPETEGSVMHLVKGERISVGDLVRAMMIWSANDAAEVLAKEAGGDIDTFCSMMNEKAASLGAGDTLYTNPNGLNPPGRVNNITTAYDIAIIAAEAMKNPDFAGIVSSPGLTIPATNKAEQRKHKSSNRCLWDTKTKFEYKGVKTPLKYDGCKGVKTGYSSTAGDCFAGYAKRGKTQLIVVVLNASHEEPKFRDAIKLWDYGFDNFRTYYAARSGDVLGKQKVAGGSLREVDLGTEEDLAATVGRDYRASENTEIEIQLNSDKVKAPVRIGTVLGAAVLADENGEELARQDLVALETARQGGPLSRIGIADEDVPVFFAIVFTAFALAVVIALLKRKRRKTGK